MLQNCLLYSLEVYMFKRPTKKQLLARRIIFSIIATLSVLIIVTVSILFMLGYRLDGGNGRIEQGALLQFDSQPSGADVWVDDKRVNGRTATKQTVFPGTHTVSMAKTGYHDWKRTLSIDAGTLTWLDYAKLVPKELPVEKLNTYKNLAATQFSPDMKWGLVLEDAAKPVLQRLDLRSENVTSASLTIPESLYAEPTTEGVTHTFSIKSWNQNGRYALIKHDYKQADTPRFEWLVLDTEDAIKTLNISRNLSVSLKDVQFVGSNGTTLFAIDNESTLRKLDLSAGTISRALVSHVDSFSIYDESKIAYVGKKPGELTKQVAGMYRDGEDDSYILREVDSLDVVLKIAVARYFDNDFVAIAQNDVITVLKGSFPNQSSKDGSSLKQVTSFKLASTATSLSFSPNSFYVVAQSNASFKTYELEHRRIHGGSISNGEAKTMQLQWLEDAQLWDTTNGSIAMRDFDGSNIHTLMNVIPGSNATLSQNGRFLYGFAKTENGYALQRVKLILN